MNTVVALQEKRVTQSNIDGQLWRAVHCDNRDRYFEQSRNTKNNQVAELPAPRRDGGA